MEKRYAGTDPPQHALQSFRARQRVLNCAIMLSFIALGLYYLVIDAPHYAHGTTAGTRNLAAVLESMDVIQVEVPIRNGFSRTHCEQTIVDYEFAASYGTPYVGTYTPPENCNFSTVIFNMSVSSEGINYDRLGLLFLGDIEIFRTSTAMPTRTGIVWNFQKDMTIYSSLLRSEQKVIMQLDNIYDTVFTGAWNMSITALYYDDDYSSALTPAEMILPLSTLSSADNASSVFTLPDDNTTLSYTLPRNAARAVVNILASGNGDEEFWYRHVPSEFTYTFNTSIKNDGPFREVQLLIDGQLAGVSWPFPIVFTGGVNPALWVPIVGVDTYDVPSYQIDISPWLGLLCDGQSHSFTMAVVGYDTTTLLGTINENWWVSGSVFIWLDSAGNQTTGPTPASHTPLPEFSLMSDIKTLDGVNTSLSLQLTGRRSLSHSANIKTSAGSQLLTWSQELSYSNQQYWTHVSTNTQNGTTYQTTTGSNSFSTYKLGTHTSSDNSTSITNTFQYPISVAQNVSYPADVTTANSSLYGAIDRSLISKAIPILAYLTSPSIFASSPQYLTTRQAGYATEYWNDTYYEDAGAIDPAKGSTGQTEQWYSYSGPVSDGSSVPVAYGRYVKAEDGYEPAMLVDEVYFSTINVPPTQPLSVEG